MSRLFDSLVIDIDKGTVYSTFFKKQIGEKTDKNGRHKCTTYDIYGNMYYFIHEIIIAEGLQLPKHLWPTEENGRRYVVDHITPISNGGTDAFENLHLIPLPDNNRNPISRKNYSKGQRIRFNSEESRDNCSNGQKKRFKNTKGTMFGKHHSESAKKKMSEAHKKPVIQSTKDDKFIKQWDSAKTAGEELKICKNCITDCCNGKLKTSGGYKWKYANIIKTNEVLLK